jgi:hypothetical protein
MRKSKLHPLMLLAIALALGACGLGAIPIPDATPTPCAGNCPPPIRSSDAAHAVRTRAFTVTYFDPWSAEDTSATGTTLVASTQFGDVTVRLQSSAVQPGVTVAQLLQRTSDQVLDPNQFSGLQDNGPINGAEVGYVSGAGESFSGYAPQPNAPDVPVFVQIMASIQGTTGITFVAISPLDPNSPDPSIVPNEEYDHIVNSVVWQ